MLFSKSERWKGVPIIISAGKKMSAKKTEVRIQFKSPSESNSRLINNISNLSFNLKKEGCNQMIKNW